MNSKPVIGVTGPCRGGRTAWIMTRLALMRAGARAVRITPGAPVSMDLVQGIVLGGGSDISPLHYGQELQTIKKDLKQSSLRDKFWSGLVLLLRLALSMKSRPGQENGARDALEKQICLHALTHRMPVLGICRGAQMINIVLGGTLHQNIHQFYTETIHFKTVLPRKEIRLPPYARLASILGTKTCFVNSLHDQAINTLGRDIIVAAEDADTIIQAVEYLPHPFMIGVQWHPEYLPQIKTQQRLFSALARISRTG